jgi:hypothetical protein
MELGTYANLLDMLGVSHIAFMVILVILFLIFSFVVMLWKLGLMTSIRFTRIAFPQSNIIYTKYKGRYSSINTKVQEVINDTKKYFLLSELFGIYFDPKETTNPSNMEAALGIIVREDEKTKTEEFMKIFSEKYKTAVLPATSCVGTHYPYFNSASLVMIVNRVYPRLAEYVKAKKIHAGPGVLEIYHLVSSSPNVEILAPTENHEAFVLP